MRRSVINFLGSAGQNLSDTLLTRVLARTEQHLEGLLDRLFEGELLPDMSLLHHQELVFTPDEPAINVYNQGGEFEPHMDHHSLTILLVLSDEEDFTGGGTGFWPKANPKSYLGWPKGADHTSASANETEPLVVLAPPAGTALLWGQKVLHAGQPVLSGERCAMVASFSLPKNAPGR